MRPTWEPDWFVRPQNTCHLRQFPKFFRCINIPPTCRSTGSLIPSSFESNRPATPLPKSQKGRSVCIFSVTVFGFQKRCGWMWRRYRYPFLASKRSFTRSKFRACVRDQRHCEIGKFTQNLGVGHSAGEEMRGRHSGLDLAYAGKIAFSRNFRFANGCPVAQRLFPQSDMGRSSILQATR